MKFWRKKMFENFSKFFESVTKMVPKLENIGFLRIFWLVRTKNFGYVPIAEMGPPTPPPNSSAPPQKVLSSCSILMKQKPKDRSWSKLSFDVTQFFWLLVPFWKKLRKLFKIFKKFQNYTFLDFSTFFRLFRTF